MKPRPQALRNRAQLSKFTWRNQEPALAEPGDAAGLAGAGGGVSGGVISRHLTYPTPWAAGVVGGAAGCWRCNPSGLLDRPQPAGPSNHLAGPVNKPRLSLYKEVGSGPFVV